MARKEEDQQMQVNVFVSRQEGRSRNEYLMLPMNVKAPVLKQYRVGWQYYATTSTTDNLFGDIDALAIDAEISASGFALVDPEVPDRR
jgi:hypothetical protein